MVAPLVVLAATLPAVVVAQGGASRYPDYTRLNYTLIDIYEGETFFDNFNYFYGYDPAHGLVHYVPRERAIELNLTHASNSSAFLKVDTTVGPRSRPDASTGRFSVRIESKRQYEKGLFLFDVKHTPFGCGTWPALWLTDPLHWPRNGEIDVMEASNQGTSGNTMALHTSAGCNMSASRLMTGSAGQSDCHNLVNSNTGCTVYAPAPATYGAAFNGAGGGVMALELRNEGIRIWQFSRSGIPVDVLTSSPDPSTWGPALADYPGTSCDIGRHFRNQSIIANIDLCGDLVNSNYATSGCPSTCTRFIANNPWAFFEAYWEFGPFKIYSAG